MRHDLVKAVGAAPTDEAAELANLLLDQARILDGEVPADPAAFARRLNTFVVRGLGKATRNSGPAGVPAAAHLFGLLPARRGWVRGHARCLLHHLLAQPLPKEERSVIGQLELAEDRARLNHDAFVRRAGPMRPATTSPSRSPCVERTRRPLTSPFAKSTSTGSAPRFSATTKRSRSSARWNSSRSPVAVIGR